MVDLDPREPGTQPLVYRSADRSVRVDDLVLVAVPDHGSTVWLETRGDALAGLGTDMRPGSPVVEVRGAQAPSLETPGPAVVEVQGAPAPSLETPGPGSSDRAPTHLVSRLRPGGLRTSTSDQARRPAQVQA